jgi:hypothetical protein
MRLGFRYGAGGRFRVSTMNKRATGVVFIAVAAFLFATRYIAAAIFGSGVRSWEAGLFDAMLEYVGPELPILSGVSLLAGVVYLVLAEVTRKP